MVEKKKTAYWMTHLGLICGVVLIFFPVWVAFVGSTVSQDDIIYPPLPLLPGPHLIDNYANALFRGGPEGYAGASQVPVIRMLMNSAIMAFGIASLSVFVSMMAAYSLVYFKTRFSTLFFWLIFITLLVPLELRILPSYQIVSDLNLLNSYAGLILPLSASAIATFFFRQYYRSIPEELLEAAKLDGANSWKFFIDFLVPLSKTMIAAMFIFMFVYGYNQYLWPLIMTTSEKYWTVVMGLKMIYGGNSVDRYTYVILSLIPPVIIIVFLQRLFIQGLFQSK